ncbi:MAG: type II toxin-antitoxin system RelE/ParE family toxin [Candidatus Sulfotelmatobacter sp.]
MAAKPLQIHPAALAELKSAVAWYQQRSQTAALNFVAELDRAIDLVIESPRRWPSGEHGTRKFVLQRYPFAVIYREKETVVQVLAIAHGRRRPAYWNERL